MTQAAWSIADKIVLLTGATSGIGLTAAQSLARQGARLILIGRDPGKIDAALAQVRAAGGASATALRCDFSSQASIRELAAQVQASHDRLDVLINNAGAVYKDRTVTQDGIEATFAVNHLGYFLLTHLLTDLVVRSAPARVINVASIGHRRGTLDFADLGFEKGGYSIMNAYRRSKLANVLFTRELARRLQGSGVTVTSLHPGGVATNIWSGAPLWAKPIIALFMRPFMLTPEQGGAFLARLATDPALSQETGAYFEKEQRVEPAPLALDAALGQRLWQVSEELTGLR